MEAKRCRVCGKYDVDFVVVSVATQEVRDNSQSNYSGGFVLCQLCATRKTVADRVISWVKRAASLGVQE